MILWTLEKDRRFNCVRAFDLFENGRRVEKHLTGIIGFTTKDILMQEYRGFLLIRTGGHLGRILKDAVIVEVTIKVDANGNSCLIGPNCFDLN